MTYASPAGQRRSTGLSWIACVWLTGCSIFNTADPPVDEGSRDGDGAVTESKRDGGDREDGQASDQPSITSAVTDGSTTDSGTGGEMDGLDATPPAGDAGDAAAVDGDAPCHDDDAGVCPRDLCTPGVTACGGLAQCLRREGRYRCACPGYYLDLYGDGSQCVDNRVLSVAAYGGGYSAVGLGLAGDGDGNVYWVGGFQGVIGFPNLPLHISTGSSPPHTATTAQDGYIVKLDRDFTPIWSRTFGAAGEDLVTRISADPSGNLIIAGQVNDVVQFDGVTLGRPGEPSSFVAKLSSVDGRVLWARALPHPAWHLPFHGWVWNLKTDASGNAYATGRFAGSYDFGTAEGSVQATGPADAYVVKLAPDGSPLWVRTIGATETSLGLAVAIDGEGNVLMTGSVEGEATFDRGPRDGYGRADAFLTKLDPDGNRLWSVRFGGADNDYGLALATGDNDEILVSGAFYADLTWDDEQRPAGSGISAYLARLDRDGNLIWLTRMETESPADAPDPEARYHALVTTPDGVFMVGAFASTLRFADGTILRTQGVKDMFLARFTHDGIPAWAHSFGGGDFDEAAAVALGPNGELLATGWFAGRVAFGQQSAQSAVWLAAMLLRMRP